MTACDFFSSSTNAKNVMHIKMGKNSGKSGGGGGGSGKSGGGGGSGGGGVRRASSFGSAAGVSSTGRGGGSGAGGSGLSGLRGNRNKSGDVDGTYQPRSSSAVAASMLATAAYKSAPYVVGAVLINKGMKHYENQYDEATASCMMTCMPVGWDPERQGFYDDSDNEILDPVANDPVEGCESCTGDMVQNSPKTCETWCTSKCKECTPEMADMLGQDIGGGLGAFLKGVSDGSGFTDVVFWSAIAVAALVLIGVVIYVVSNRSRGNGRRSNATQPTVVMAPSQPVTTASSQPVTTNGRARSATMPALRGQPETNGRVSQTERQRT